MVSPYVLRTSAQTRGLTVDSILIRDAARVNPPAGDWYVFADSAQSASQPVENWWKNLNDQLLDSIIAIGTANSYDAVMATRRIAIAKAQLGQTRSAYFPQIGLNIGYDKMRNSGYETSRHTPATDLSYFSGTASLSWEIDVFGKITSAVKTGKAQVRVSRAEAAGVEVSLAAEIASQYIGLRVHQAELAVANQHSISQKKALKIAEARFETGLASMMDVHQAREVYYTTTASIPTLENSIRSDINAIAVLLADTAVSLRDRLAVPAPLPDYIQLVNAGAPADLLRRRPDIVQAEEQIAVCAAQLGIARKDWLPTLSLNASAGTVAHKAGDLFSKDSFTYSIAPSLSWTLFDGMSRSYGIAGARRSMENAIDNYNLTVLTAMSEVDNSLSSYFSTLKYIENLSKATEASEKYDTLALDNYKNGLSPFINVADAQMSYLENVNALIVAKGNALQALVTLYKALGGGWIKD